MNRILLLLTLTCLSVVSFAQNTLEKTMEKRAREMHRVICLNDKDVWKNFIKENYTQRLIDKPMQAKVQTTENGSTSSSSSEIKATDNLEAKAQLFERFHEDFGNSKIVSIKPAGEKLEMVLQSDMLTGTFRLTFEKNSPYKIDGFGVEAGN